MASIHLSLACNPQLLSASTTTHSILRGLTEAIAPNGPSLNQCEKPVHLKQAINKPSDQAAIPQRTVCRARTTTDTASPRTELLRVYHRMNRPDSTIAL
jgi:hypothetical protein